MDFRWPARHDEALPTSEAFLIAMALTVCATAAISGPLAHMHGVTRDALPVSAARVREAVAFVVPTPVRVPERKFPKAPPIRQPASGVRPDVPSVAAQVDQPRSSISTSDVAPPVDAVNADSQKVSAPPVVDARRPAAGPVIATSAFSRSMTQAEREAIPQLSLLGPSLLGPDRRKWRLVSDTEKEGFVNEERQRYEILREHKPADVAARGGLLSIPLGLFGGPSRAQRKRDSVIHHDNLLRLGRLADRAQAKRDSMRVEDSLARLGKKALP